MINSSSVHDRPFDDGDAERFQTDRPTEPGRTKAVTSRSNLLTMRGMTHGITSPEAPKTSTLWTMAKLNLSESSGAKRSRVREVLGSSSTSTRAHLCTFRHRETSTRQGLHERT